MLNDHKTKIDLETSALCEVCKIKETLSHYLLECNRFMKEREALLNKIASILIRKEIVPQNVTIEELLGEQNVSIGDSETIEIY